MANRPPINMARIKKVIEIATAVANFMTATLRLLCAAVSCVLLVAPFLPFLP